MHGYKTHSVKITIFILTQSQVSFTEMRENPSIESLEKIRKDLRGKYYLNAIDKDLIIFNFGGFKKCHNTWQQGDLFVPSIRANACFYSFWPRDLRELRQSK